MSVNPDSVPCDCRFRQCPFHKKPEITLYQNELAGDLGSVFCQGLRR